MIMAASAVQSDSEKCSRYFHYRFVRIPQQKTDRAFKGRFTDTRQQLFDDLVVQTSGANLLMQPLSQRITVRIDVFITEELRGPQILANAMGTASQSRWSVADEHNEPSVHDERSIPARDRETA
jgi:hypothetical protein